MRCVICGRKVLKAAAWVPGGEDKAFMPHPPGPVGPTCARRAGLIERTLFTRRRNVVTASRLKARPASPQLELLEAAA